ncbi:flagellar export protein FliJ [Pseudomonas typographi]|uniref:Flagellar FliJ protein n=1 Tax=Pseudomonas typographi TaxID=2715964 RepID=A0ABR7Z517_9PSED|nr:flagellar export protein FliJ [Pseudomonas typographi]MBD1553953.1 flagella biosynthesis chaperone FliJ [Pseudomonas typographi]MBD1588032.1 flagella biosynthesis chaperone FliJ [Pseudomonas typographi]MBD1600414.1 flagella biosynthesis chaperone FliJ [Pseudomonas typographi]
MAASRAARLAPVIEMAEKVERNAAQRLGHLQGQLQIAQGKLQELEQFRANYQEQWIKNGTQGVSGQWLLNYQRFLTQLETAVGQQRRSLAWHENNLDSARKTWQDAYARACGLRKLVERYMAEARRLEDKREQRLLDELSQRLPRSDGY